MASDESRYFKSGLQRGLDGKDAPLGWPNIAGKQEEKAAQRGWESGRTIRANTEATNAVPSTDYGWSDSTSGESDGGGHPDESLRRFVWYVVASFVTAPICVFAMSGVNTFSFVWWLLCLATLACIPGILVGGFYLVVAGALLCAVLTAILLAALLIVKLVSYFVQNPI